MLVYLTTPAQQAGLKHDTVLGDPAMPVNRFARQMESAGAPLTAEQRSQLLNIFTEEFARVDNTPVVALAADAVAAREREEIKACYARIRERAQTVLDEAQFNRFQAYERLASAQAQQRVRPRWSRAEPFYHWLISRAASPGHCRGPTQSPRRHRSYQDRENCV